MEAAPIEEGDPRLDNGAPAAPGAPEPDVEPDIAELDIEDEVRTKELPEAGGQEKDSEPKVDSATGSAKRATPARRNRSGSTRLPKGALRGQVEDYLLEHTGDHSPVEIGQALGRSSGAVANALETLVELGDAVQTSEQPKRYSHAEHADDTETDSASIGPNGRRAAPGASARPRTRIGGGAAAVGVGTYVTVMAVVPLEATGAVTTAEIADWLRARLPEPVVFATATHGVTRAALASGADPTSWAADPANDAGRSDDPASSDDRAPSEEPSPSDDLPPSGAVTPRGAPADPDTRAADETGGEAPGAQEDS